MPRRRGDPWRTPDGMTAQSLRSLRDRRFRRSPAHRVHGEREALTFVREVGFCSTFYRFPEGVACLWEAVAGRANPRWPRHSHHDAGIGLTWELKDTLPARKRVYYGKLLKGRPLLVALDLFPAFYALIRGRQRARDYRVEYEAGRLSHTARRIMDAMLDEHPQYTRELRANVFMLEPTKTREVERGLAGTVGDPRPGHPLIRGRCSRGRRRSCGRRSCTAAPPSARRSARSGTPIGRSARAERVEGPQTGAGAPPCHWYTTPHG